jgi:hypothetical protein
MASEPSGGATANGHPSAKDGVFPQALAEVSNETIMHELVKRLKPSAGPQLSLTAATQAFGTIPSSIGQTRESVAPLLNMEKMLVDMHSKVTSLTATRGAGMPYQNQPHDSGVKDQVTSLCAAVDSLAGHFRSDAKLMHMSVTLPSQVC